MAFLYLIATRLDSPVNHYAMLLCGIASRCGRCIAVAHLLWGSLAIRLRLLGRLLLGGDTLALLTLSLTTLALKGIRRIRQLAVFDVLLVILLGVGIARTRVARLAARRRRAVHDQGSHSRMLRRGHVKHVLM